MSRPCPAPPQSPSPVLPRCLVLGCWCYTGAGGRGVVPDEMPGNPVMSVGTQRNNVAHGYTYSSSSARCSHFPKEELCQRSPRATGLLWNPATRPDSWDAASGRGWNCWASLLLPGQQSSAPQGSWWWYLMDLHVSGMGLQLFSPPLADCGPPLLTASCSLRL